MEAMEEEASKNEILSASSSSPENVKGDAEEGTESVTLESTESKSNDDDSSDSSHGDRLNKKGNIKSSTSTSEMVVGESQNKSKEPYCCPKQVLRLLADHDYCFRQEDWKLKKNLQAENPERIHLVVIVAEKYGKQTLTGMGMGGNFSLAETCAAIDLCEQLEMNHRLVLPKSDIHSDLRLSSSVESALKTVCYTKKVSARWFKQTKGRAASGSFRTWNIVVGHLKIQGRGVTDDIAKQEAAYKMYKALTGEAFPLVEILKGERCSGEFDRYHQTSNREFQMKNIKMPNRGLMPAGFRASIKAKTSAPLVPEVHVSDNAEKCLEVPSEVEVEGLRFSQLSGSGDVKNEQRRSEATDLGAGAEEVSSQVEAASTDDVDQTPKVEIAEIENVITPDTWTIVEVRDQDRDYLPYETAETWQDCILHTITSLVIFGVIVVVMMAWYYVSQ